MSRVLVPFAAGFEEIETATIVDVLRRAGVEVVLAGIDGAAPVVGSRMISFVPDAAFADVSDEEWDLVVLPGGLKNAEQLATHEPLLDLLRGRVYAGARVAAICAGPLALDAAGVLPSGGWTCFPALQGRMKAAGWQDEPVVEHAGITTSQGPATAMRFALHLVGKLVTTDKAGEVARALLL